MEEPRVEKVGLGHLVRSFRSTIRVLASPKERMVGTRSIISETFARLFNRSALKLERSSKRLLEVTKNPKMSCPRKSSKIECSSF